MKKVTLLTSKMCGSCKDVKREMEKLKLNIETLQYDDVQNLDFFRLHQIKTVPSLVIVDGDKIEKIGGAFEIMKYLNEHVNEL